MRPGAATFALLLLAAGVAGGAEPDGAPLESSKAALKALQADQAAKKGAANGGLGETLPPVQTPAPDAIPLDLSSFQPSAKSDQERKKKKDAQKNWLVDGVDQLGRGAKGRGAKTEEESNATPDENSAKPDSSDPDYLLKVYTEQKKQSDAKAEARLAARTRSNDPIAPFLQNWMGNSPVRGKFFDEFARRPETGPGSAGAAGSAEPGSNPAAGSAVFADNRRPLAPAAPAANPYLQGLDAPAPADPGRLTQSMAAPATLGGPTVITPASQALDPLPAGREVGKKPPLLAPSDNEKYFPQQKKF